LIVYLLNLVVVLAVITASAALARDVTIGDSRAVGVGHPLRIETHAKVGG